MTPEEIVQRVDAAVVAAAVVAAAVVEGAVVDAAVGEGSVGEASAGPVLGGAICEVSQGMVTVVVPPAGWLAALAFARDKLDCDFFDWLSAVDELDAGLAVVAHVYSLAGSHHLLVRTLVGPGGAGLPTATGIYRGAAWHERETHEMFGVVFADHPGLAPLLLPDGFDGHPLRKNFVLVAREAKEWPGAKDPGDRAGVTRGGRRLPPGAPEGRRPA